MVGLPGQTLRDLAGDIRFFKELNANMIGMGPYITEPGTPVAGAAITQRPKSWHAWKFRAFEAEKGHVGECGSIKRLGLAAAFVVSRHCVIRWDDMLVCHGSAAAMRCVVLGGKLG